MWQLDKCNGGRGGGRWRYGGLHVVYSVASYSDNHLVSVQRLYISFLNNQDTSLYNEIGVSTSNRNIPVFYFRSNGREESFALTIFDVFTPGPPDDSNFDVPHSCSVPSVLDQSKMKESLISEMRNGGKNIEEVRSAMFRKADALMKQADE